MENASKALIMAGSILIALLVIGVASFMYQQLSNVKQTESDVEASEKAANYMKAFEQYNRTIYGSELLSLGNLQADYNMREADMKGFNPVTIQVQIIKEIKENGRLYIGVGTYNISAVRSKLFDLEDAIEVYEQDDNGYKNKKERKKRSVKYYAQLSNRQIATLFDIGYTSSEPDYDIGNRLADRLQCPDTYKLMADIEKYKNLKTTYTEFKNTSFTCKEIKYDKIGRISSMLFKEN